MKQLSLKLKILLGIITVCLIYAFGVKNETEKEWISLFNGKNLEGWTPKIKGFPLNVNYQNTFRVVDGKIQVNYDGYDDFETKFGHLFYQSQYSNYIFKLKYRFIGDQAKGGQKWALKNSGVMIHCQDPKTMLKDQDFPISIEVQLLGGYNEGDRPTGNVCTPGTEIIIDDETVEPHCLNSNSKTYHDDQWIDLEIEVKNDEYISHKINGELVLSYKKPTYGGSMEKEIQHINKKIGGAVKSGYISLQSESHPIEFKDIKLLNLD